MSDKVFIDSNVLLYALDKTGKKKKNALQKILKGNEIIISPQVVFECLNVTTRKFKLPKNKALSFIANITKFCEISAENAETVTKALELYRKHSLQVFDAKIIASALLADCKILYSEDMQDGQLFEGKLKIINPFH